MKNIPNALEFSVFMALLFGLRIRLHRAANSYSIGKIERFIFSQKNQTESRKHKCVWYIYLVLLGLIVCTTLYGQPARDSSDLPLYCYDQGYIFTDDTVTFGDGQKPSSEPVVYFLKNTSNSKIWLNHAVENKSASAGWATELTVGKWTALALNNRPFELGCVELKPGAEQVIPCESVLQVCQLRHVRFVKSNTGSYWAAENLSLDQLIDALEKRGISIKNK